MPPFTEDELLCRLALTFIDGIGPKTARALLGHFGNAQSILRAPVRELKGVGGMGEVRARACKNAALMQHAEVELRFVEKHAVRAIFFTDEDYPARLKACED